MTSRPGDEPLEHGGEYLDVVFGNLADKVARYGLYIDRVRSEAQSERIDPPVLRDFDERYRDLCEEVGDLYAFRFDAENRLDQRHFLGSCLEQSKNLWKQFMDANEFLGFAPRQWAKPELFALADEFLAAAGGPGLETSVTIALTDDYKYWWLDASPTSDSRIVAIPKIEKDDPLLWTLIAHEVGHELDERYAVSDQAAEDLLAMPQLRNMSNPGLIGQWAAEIFSDLYGLHLLGPSYYAAFISYVLAREPLRSIWEPLSGADRYTSQPPIGVRTRCMTRVMQTAGDTGWQLDVLQRFINTHEAVVCVPTGGAERSQLELREALGWEGPDSEEEIEYDLCRPLVASIQGAAESSGIPMAMKENGQAISTCKERLKKWIPACSTSAGTVDPLSELPCDVATIVNSAWRCKASYHPRLYTELFRQRYEVAAWDEAFADLKRHLHDFDSLVLTSMGVASVHAFYRRYWPDSGLAGGDAL